MYKVYYYNSNQFVVNKVFNTLTEATDFALKQSKETVDSILEIKHYDDKTPYTQD
jgi:hypothetical protein|tara:strand:- start:28 stop:192 length:165 start_codon:yes stop_codon:yes gene_type:complete